MQQGMRGMGVWGVRLREDVSACDIQVDRLTATVLEELAFVVTEDNTGPLLPLPHRPPYLLHQSCKPPLRLPLPHIPPLVPLPPQTVRDQEGLVHGEGKCRFSLGMVPSLVFILDISNEGDGDLARGRGEFLVDGALGVELERGEGEGAGGGEGEFVMGGSHASRYFIMFLIDFKPQFLNYPLDPHEYARVTLRAGEIAAQLSRLQAEMVSLQQLPEYASLYQDSHDKYSQYLQRLRGKMAVLSEEQKEVQQVVALHLNIEQSARTGRKDRPEVKHRLLEQYKAAMVAKRSKQAAEHMREVELERQILEGEGEGGSQSAALVRPQRVLAKPERHVILGRFQEPTLALVRFRDSHSEHRNIKNNPLQRHSMSRSVKLPPVPPSPGFLLHSAPIKLSHYEINDSHLLPRTNPKIV